MPHAGDWHGDWRSSNHGGGEGRGQTPQDQIADSSDGGGYRGTEAAPRRHQRRPACDVLRQKPANLSGLVESWTLYLTLAVHFLRRSNSSPPVAWFCQSLSL